MYKLEFLRAFIFICCEPNPMKMWITLANRLTKVKGGHVTIAFQLL